MDYLIMLVPYFFALAVAFGTLSLVRFAHAALEDPEARVAQPTAHRLVDVRAPMVFALTFPACLSVGFVAFSGSGGVPMIIAIGQVAAIAVVFVRMALSRADRRTRDEGYHRDHLRTVLPSEGTLTGDEMQVRWENRIRHLQRIAVVGTVAALPVAIGLAWVSTSLGGSTADPFALQMASIMFVGPSFESAVVLTGAAFSLPTDSAFPNRTRSVLLCVAAAIAGSTLLWLFGWQLKGAT